jgi:hypothetical protein
MPAPRHARPPRHRPLAVATAVALGAAAVAVPLAAQATPGAPKAPVEPAGDDAHVLRVALARLPAVRHPALPATVTVRPGDTLWALAGRVCGNPRDDLALAYNNGISDPDRIFAGQVLRAACQAAAAVLAVRYPPASPPARVTSAASQPPPRLAAEVTSSGYFGCGALEALWDGAGGNPASAFTAAEVAMAESGGNPDAISPTDDYGLWQINASNGALATLNPYANARSAVILSDDGTNWSAWTTYRDGLETGRC